jgi:hypothetical protein
VKFRGRNAARQHGNPKQEEKMSIYETVKGTINLREAAERYGVESNHSGMALCPFHNDHHPSLLLEDDHYYCFACGEHGDVIDFTAKLFDLSPSEAARKLAADFSVPVCDTGQLSSNPIPSNQLAKAQRIRQAERQCLSVCMDYARLLAEWKARYAPKSPEEIPDPRFTEACRKLDEYEYYVDLLTSGSGSERTELVEMLTADGTITNLQNRILQARKEEIPHAGNDRPR